MYKLPEMGEGGGGNSDNARKKTFFFEGGVPLTNWQICIRGSERGNQVPKVKELQSKKSFALETI